MSSHPSEHWYFPNTIFGQENRYKLISNFYFFPNLKWLCSLSNILRILGFYFSVNCLLILFTNVSMIQFMKAVFNVDLNTLMLTWQSFFHILSIILVFGIFHRSEVLKFKTVIHYFCPYNFSFWKKKIWQSPFLPLADTPRRVRCNNKIYFPLYTGWLVHNIWAIMFHSIHVITK